MRGHCGKFLALIVYGGVLSSCDTENGSSADQEITNSTAIVEESHAPRETAAPQQPPVESEESQAEERIAISCTKPDDPYTEIYIIDEEQEKFFFYNQQSRSIQPSCRGEAECNWDYSENRISFDNPGNGFIIAQTLNRVNGEMTSRFAMGDTQFSVRTCQRVDMPPIASNRF